MMTAVAESCPRACQERTPLLRDGDAQESCVDGNSQPASRNTLKKQTPRSTIRGVVSVLLIGVFIAQADSSIILATSQSIASEFHALSNASWLVTSYALAQCAAQPLYGKLSDIFGRKANLVVAYVFFTIGCAFCGGGLTYGQVLFGRAISGIGGAGMLALVSIVVADLLPVREVATWRSYINVVATFGRSCGGPTGGWLANTIGWRWCFLAQCPIAALAAVLVIWMLPQGLGSDDTDSDATERQDLRTKFARVDFLGCLTLSATLISLFIALDLGGKLSPWYEIAPTALLALVLGGSFYYAERHYAQEPVLPLDLVKKRDVLTPYAIVLFLTGAQFMIIYTIPIYFQIITGMSVTDAGTRIVPIVLGNAVGGLLSGYYINKTQRYKLMMLLGASLGCANYILVLVRWHGASSWADTSYIVLGGLGIGIIQSTTFIHLTVSLDQREMSIAGTSWFLAQNFGVLIAANLYNLIHNATLERFLQETLEGIPDESRIIKEVISSLEYIWDLPEDLRALVIRCFLKSLTFTNGLILSFGVISLLISTTIRERRLPD